VPEPPARAKRPVEDKSALPRSVLRRPANLEWSHAELLRTVLTSFIASAYSPLMESLILDFRREDPRLLLADELTFVWLLGFCMRFERLEHGAGFDWAASPLFKTMDLWAFSYVVTKVETNLENKKSFAALETATASLLEMMLALDDVAKQGDVGVGLRNAVMYELHERLDVVHRLLKAWNPDQYTRAFLRDVVTLADVTLNVVEVMAREGALRKAKQKAATKREAQDRRVFGTPWGAEETNALYEGVKDHGNDAQALKKILAAPAYAGVLAENKRTVKQLAARWDVIREHIAQGRTLDALVTDELTQGSAAVDGEDGSAEDGGDDDAAATAIKPMDVHMDFFASLRPFMHNDVVYNLTRLVDPALAKDVRESVTDSNAHHLVAVFYRRLRGFDVRLRQAESLEPMLWCARALRLSSAPS